MNIRLKLLASIFFIGFLFLVGRLFFWQIVRGRDLSKEARSQYESERPLLAPRGSILAKDGTWLVARGEAYSVYGEPPKFKLKTREIADKLAPFFVEDLKDRTLLLNEVDRIDGILSRKGVVWVPIKQKIGAETMEKIENEKIDGIGFEKVEDRVYPEGSSSAQLLGFVGKDKDGNDLGYFGLEGYYNLTLSGKPGFEESEKDAKGRPILIGDTKNVSSAPGVDLMTNIDKAVQGSIEKNLAEGVEKYEASAGTVIVMDPKNGAIFGMASYPSYDPRSYWKYSDELFKNPAVSDAFEPGSVFKIIVMAAALDASAVEPDTICDICDGPLKVDKYLIETWNKKYNPDSTMVDVIVHSDNVGMSFVAQKLGADKLYDYLDRFGIGRPTGIDLQGEITPKLREKGSWNIVDLATASFGQGVAITPIQMITAGSIIANGGKMVTPQVVSSLKGEGWEEPVKPKVDGRVISEKTAQEMSAMMVEAARYGESKWTSLKGFKVAGKTGTAQIPIAGHYDAEKTMASFIGFAPADNPKFIMFVSLKEPKSSQWASETAAPLWYSIAKDLFSYFGIQPES